MKAKKRKKTEENRSIVVRTKSFQTNRVSFEFEKL